MIKAKPFVKWAGGKGKLLTQLEQLLPKDFDEQQDITYIEPFVGGGAMLFHMLQNHKNIRRVVINDINPDLIQCYRFIKDNPKPLIDRLKELEQSYFEHDALGRKELFYLYRDLYNQENHIPEERASLFIYLNRLCFNGLYRVNASGKFNVPYGRYQHPIICNEELIMEDHKLLNSVDLTILNGDYSGVARHLSTKKQKFLYFDPPYRPLLKECNFKEYSNSPFGDKQQEELKAFCDKLTQNGCWLMLSNSDSKNMDGSSYFEELYDTYQFDRVLAPRAINAFPDKRVKMTEVLIRNYR